MPQILQNKTAVITGATGVIGQAIARALAEEGCTLILSGRSETKLQTLAKELQSQGVKAYIQPARVEEESEVKKIMDLSVVKAGIDILILAHGTYGYIGPVEAAEPGDWLEAIKVNFFGTFLCIKYGLPLFKPNTIGKIITFAGGGEGPLPNFSSYVTSKAAILRLTETLAAELKEKQVEVNAISPGAVNSGLNQELLAAGQERVGKKMNEQTLKQISGEEGVSADKAAALAVFLSSDESNGLSGKNISAVWDNWRDIPKHLKELQASDVYALRRVKPKDRGYDW